MNAARSSQPEPRGPADLARRRRRNQAFSAAALAVTAVGIVLAALQPAWLVDPLRGVVDGSGAAAPVVFVLLCIVASPAHLNGVLVALSVVVWPWPTAAALSFTGSLLGCLITAGVLVSLGAGPARQSDGWPPWLERLAVHVARRPIVVGLTLRIVVQSGVAVEGFFLLSGYRRSTYLVVATIGLAVWVAQTFAGVAGLAALVAISPWLGFLLVVVPLVLGAGVVAVTRCRGIARARATGAPAPPRTGPGI
jgi:hypothetical protein